MASIGDLVANLTMNTAGFVAGARTGQAAIGKLASGVTSQVGNITSSLARIGLAFQGLQGLRAAFEGTLGAPIRLAAEFEQTGVAFEVMLGTASAATAMLGEMRRLAATSPLELRDVTDAGRTLLQFGVASDSVLPSLRMLGDVSGGNSQRFKQMALAFGQMSAAGRLMGQDLLQMINAGFNPLQTMSEQTGKSIGELKKQMEAGEISTQMVVDAFRAATEEGGRFHGMMQKQSQTTEGQMAKLRDATTMLAVELGRMLLPAVNKLVSGMSALVEFFGRFPKAIVAVTVAAVSLVASLKAIAIAQATIKALSGPAGWAALAASLAIASAATFEISGAFDKVATSAQQAEAAVSGLAKASGDWKAEFSGASGNLSDIIKNIERLEQLRFIREAQPELGKALADPVIAGLENIASANSSVDEVGQKVIQLRGMIDRINQSIVAGDTPRGVGAQLIGIYTSQLNDLTGVTKATQAAMKELDALMGVTDTQIAIRELRMAGATEQAVEQFARLREQIDMTKKSQEDFNSAAKGVAGIRQLNEEGVAVEQPQPKRGSVATTGVAVAQSREAMSIIARAANDSRNPLLNETKKQTGVLDEMKDMIGDLPDQFGKSIKLEVASIV